MPKKVAILIDHLYQDSEVIDPQERLQKEGYTVDIIGFKNGEVYEGKRGAKVTSTKSIDEVSAKDYEAVVIPGGWAPDKMRMNKKMVKFIQEINNSKKPVASICHGGWMLVEADVVKGKTVTSYQSIQTDLKNAGAKWVDKEVVVDGNLISSRTPDDLPAFCDALIKALSKVAV